MRSLARLLARFHDDAFGSTAAEFAFVAPVLILLLFGIMEYGRLLWTKNSLEYAVERAARCAAIYYNKGTSCTDASATQSYAVSQVNGVTGAAVASAAFTVTYSGGPPPTTACVSASLPFAFLVLNGLMALAPHHSSSSHLPSVTLSGQSCRAIPT